MARIAVVGIGPQVASTTSPSTITLPKGIRQNDLMVMMIGAMPGGTAGTNDAITLTGWTQRGTTSRVEIGTIDCSVQLWYKVAGSAETDPSLAVGSALAGGGTTQGFTGQVAVFRGVDTTTPFDVTSVNSTSAAAATFTPTGLTTVTNNAVAISAVCTADDNALGFSASQSFVALMSGVNYDTTTGSDHAVAFGVKEITTAGAVTMPTWSETVNGNDAWACTSAALRPATTVYALEQNWLLPDTTAWPSGVWTPSVSTGSTITTDLAGGKIATGVAGSYADSAEAITSDAAFPDDFELWVDLTVDSAGNEQWIDLQFRKVDSINFYNLEITPISGYSGIELKKRVAAADTSLWFADSTTTFSVLAVGDVVHLHLLCSGSSLQVKWWLNNAAEPGSFSSGVITDTSFAGGALALASFGGAAAASRIVHWRALQVQSLASSSATAAAASATGAANSLVTSGFTALAPSATASAFSSSSTRTTTAATGVASAYGLTVSSTPVAASSTATAFTLSRPGGAALAVATSTASAFPQSSTRNTVVATGVASAFNLAAIQGMIAASSTVAAFNLGGTRSISAGTATATANNLVASTPFSATAAVATSTATSFNLSNGRALGLASSTAIANVIGLTGQPVAIYAQVQATGLDLQNVLIGAEPFGSGRTPAVANSTATAYNLSYTDSVTLVQAAATAAAQFLSRTTFLPTTANVTAVAFGIVNLIAAQSANASAVAGDLTSGLRSPIAASANAVAWNPHNQFYGVLAATASAVAFGGPGASSVGAFALAQTLAYSLGNNSLIPLVATATATASPFSTGDVLAYASVSVLAQNLGLTASPVLSGATASAGAFPLNVTPTSSMSVASASSAAAGLGTADALSAASSGAAAGPLAGTRQETAATASVLAYGLVGASSPLLAGASALAVAYGLGNLTLAAGTMAAAAASVQAFNSIPFILASLGQAPTTASAFLLSEFSGGSTTSSTATTSAFGMGRGLTPYVATVNGQANDLLNRALLTSSFASADASAYGLTVFAIQPGLGKVHSGVGSSGVHTGVGTSYGVHTELVS